MNKKWYLGMLMLILVFKVIFGIFKLIFLYSLEI